MSNDDALCLFQLVVLFSCCHPLCLSRQRYSATEPHRLCPFQTAERWNATSQWTERNIDLKTTGGVNRRLQRFLLCVWSWTTTFCQKLNLKARFWTSFWCPSNPPEALLSSGSLQCVKMVSFVVTCQHLEALQKHQLLCYTAFALQWTSVSAGNCPDFINFGPFQVSSVCVSSISVVHSSVYAAVHIHRSGKLATSTQKLVFCLNRSLTITQLEFFALSRDRYSLSLVSAMIVGRILHGFCFQTHLCRKITSVFNSNTQHPPDVEM